MKLIRKLISIFKRKRDNSSISTKKFSGDLSYLNDIPQLSVVGTVDLFEVIGKRIKEVRNEFEYNKIDGWMDYSQTFITLNNKMVICFPVTGSNEICLVKQSSKAEKIQKKYAAQIIGQKIEDIYYVFYEDKPDTSQASYILLENGFGLSEDTIGIHGTGNASLRLYTKEEMVEILNDPEADRRSVFTVFNKQRMQK